MTVASCEWRFPPPGSVLLMKNVEEDVSDVGIHLDQTRRRLSGFVLPG